MFHFPIGVMLDSFRTDTVTAIEKAAKMGAKGLQMYSTKGEHSAENLVGSKRKELLDIVKSNGLCFSALCGDFGAFMNVKTNPDLIEKSKRVLDLAKDLETDIVTTHIGVVPPDPDHPRYQVMQEACYQLSRYADEIGAHFAIETGPEVAIVLKGFLDSLNSKGVAVNLDPANLVMVTGDDPVQAVYTLKDYIVHTHAKDGRRLKINDPEVIYGVVDAVVQEGKAFEELPLGKGDVDFKSYLKALDEIGYKGFLTIEREVGEDPEKDIEKAVNYLRGIINDG